MRRNRLIPLSMLALALVSLPVLARTSPLMAANADQCGCPDADAAPVTEQVDSTTAKPAAAKRSAAPTAAKARQATPYRNAEPTPPRAAPRWHRFLPGMFR